jgi:hypothetical protein
MSVESSTKTSTANCVIPTTCVRRGTKKLYKDKELNKSSQFEELMGNGVYVRVELAKSRKFVLITLENKKGDMAPCNFSDAEFEKSKLVAATKKYIKCLEKNKRNSVSDVLDELSFKLYVNDLNKLL